MRDLPGKVKRLGVLNKKQTLVPMWCWVLLLAAYVVYFLSYMYTDIIYTAKSSINLWNALADGNLFRYYQVNGNPLHASPVFDGMLESYPVVYEFPLMLLFAVWNVPLWICDRFLMINIFDSFVCLIWIKSLTLVFLAASLWAFYRLCGILGVSEEHRLPAVFVFLSSLFVMVPLLHLSHYDIISIFFTLTGIRYYMEGHHRRFVGMFMLAGMCKLFSHLIFVPLLLLREKKIRRILASVIVVVLPSILQWGVQLLISSFFSDPIVSARGTASAYALSEGVRNFLASRLEVVGIAGIYVFLFAYGLLCVFCYAAASTQNGNFSYTAVYVAALSMICFFLFTPFYPYWIILVSPYLVLLLFLNLSRFKINMLLYMLLSVGMLFSQIFSYGWCYGAWTLDHMLWTRILVPTAQLRVAHSVDYVYMKLGMPTDITLYFTLFFIGITAFLLLNRPSSQDVATPKTITPACGKGLILSNFFVSCVITGSPIAIYLGCCLFRGTI